MHPRFSILPPCTVLAQTLVLMERYSRLTGRRKPLQILDLNQQGSRSLDISQNLSLPLPTFIWDAVLDFLTNWFLLCFLTTWIITDIAYWCRNVGVFLLEVGWWFAVWWFVVVVGFVVCLLVLVVLSHTPHRYFVSYLQCIWEKEIPVFSSHLYSFLLCYSSQKSLHSQSDLGFTAYTLKTITLRFRLQHSDLIISDTLCFSCSFTFNSGTLFEFLPADWYNFEHFQLTLHCRIVKPLGTGMKVTMMYETANIMAIACKFVAYSLRLCPQRKSLQCWGPYFVGLSVN